MIEPPPRLLACAAASVVVALLFFLLLEQVWPLPLSNQDEAIYAASAREIADGRPPMNMGYFPGYIERLGYPHLEPHQSLHAAWLGLAFLCLGASAATAHLCSALTTALAAGLVFLLGAHDWRRSGWDPGSWGDRGLSWQRGALAWACFLLFPVTWLRGTLVLIEPLQVLLGLCAVASVLSAQRAWRIGLGGALVGAAIATRQPSAVLLGWLCGLAALRGDGRQRWLEPLALLSVGLLAASLLRWAQRFGWPAEPGMSGNARAFFHAALLPSDAQAAYCYLRMAPEPPITAGTVISRGVAALSRMWPDQARVDYLATLTVLLGALACWRRQRTLSALVALGLGGILAMSLLVFFFSPEGVRHLYFLVGPAILALACAASSLPRRWAAAVVGTVLLASAGLGAWQRAELSATRTRGEPVLAAWEAIMARHAQPHAVLAVRGGFRLPWREPGLTVVELPHDLPTLRRLEERGVPLRRLLAVERLDPLAPRLRASGGDGGRWRIMGEERLEGLPVTVWERARSP